MVQILQSVNISREQWRSEAKFRPFHLSNLLPNI